MENQKIKAISFHYGKTAPLIIPFNSILALWPNGKGYDVILSGVLPDGNNVIPNGMTYEDAKEYFNVVIL